MLENKIFTVSYIYELQPSIYYSIYDSECIACYRRLVNYNSHDEHKNDDMRMVDPSRCSRFPIVVTVIYIF